MQRDFIEPGGFGESLGNDVTRLAAIVPTVGRLIGGFRAAGLPVIHTKECHRPDLSDCPPAKRERGIADTPDRRSWPDGARADRRRAGRGDRDALAPIDGEAVIEKPGKGSFYATGLSALLEKLGTKHLVFAGRDHRSLRADHHARGE